MNMASSLLHPSVKSKFLCYLIFLVNYVLNIKKCPGFSCRWMPNHHASEAIGQAIRTQFRGPYHHYDKVPEDVQLKLWMYFMVIEYNCYEL